MHASMSVNVQNPRRARNKGCVEPNLGSARLTVREVKTTDEITRSKSLSPLSIGSFRKPRDVRHIEDLFAAGL